MTDLSVQYLSELAASVAQRSETLRGLGAPRVAESIASAATLLLEPRTALGRELREGLAQSTGLSEPMIQWGLSTTLGSADFESLLSVAARIKEHGRYYPVPARLGVIILAGNIFTAALRALAIPLLNGVPVVAKASETDDLFPRFFKEALDQVDSVLGACCEVVTFSGGRVELLDALVSQAEVVAVYGSNQTVASVKARLSDQVRLVAHGHGLGATYVSSAALSYEADIQNTIGRVALDVAAYDQRGCLSPHFILVQPGGLIEGEGFARRLAEEGLEELQKSLPRGALPLVAAVEQLQWRGVGAARGRLFTGDFYAVSYEANAALRPSPGFRNVSVNDCENLDALGECLQVFGVQLKALGIAGGRVERSLAARAMRPPLAPHITDVGEMQTPRFDVLADGEDPSHGLVRWIEVGDDRTTNS
jgi:hypothetical protein